MGYASGETQGFVVNVLEAGYAFADTPEGSIFISPELVREHKIELGCEVTLGYYTDADKDGNPALAASSMSEVKPRTEVEGTISFQEAEREFSFAASSIGRIHVGGFAYKNAPCALGKGATVNLAVVKTDKGWSAVEVISEVGPKELEAHVLFYNQGKNFGFAACTDGTRVHLPKNALGNRLEQIVSGAIVKLLAAQGDRGLSATKVISVTAPTFVPATVKWFDRKKGYGVTVLEDGTEVLLHKSVTLACGVVPGKGWHLEVSVAEAADGSAAVTAVRPAAEPKESEESTDAASDTGTVPEAAEVISKEASAKKPKRKPRMTRKQKLAAAKAADEQVDTEASVSAE